MDKKDYRAKIDEIDKQLVALFAERMDICGELAKYKKENGIPVLDPKREREKLKEVEDLSPEKYRKYTSQLYSLLFELSRSHQSSVIGNGGALSNRIKAAISATPELFPESAVVACQGVEGAYSQLACEKLFRRPDIMFTGSFEAVFSAVESGLCRYGVLPVENSTAGSVNSIYDLMQSRNFTIVRSARIKIDHNLLAKPGVSLSDIREIYTHPQAISQCSEFLASLSGVTVIPCENTAIAAMRVSQSERNDIAAISSRRCMEQYGLECLSQSVQNSSGNYTRFICISKELEIYPGADRTSFMATLPHKPGSLYKLLSKLYALGINLNKLESRPLPDRDFEFMFYFDLDTPVYSPEFLRLADELGDVCESFVYLGSYSEVI